MRYALLASATSLFCTVSAIAQNDYVHFESPTVHPLSISPDGTRLFAANTADARLSVFDLSQPSNPQLIAEIPVGVEPVSVKARTNDEVWVVNHTSDSVSIVSVSQGIVTDTIRTKDEPCDVVFAGSPQRAYVSASRSNAILVFDAATHAAVAAIPVLGENPRSLAVSPDGTKVYAAFALSGNRTTLVPAAQAPPQPNVPGLPTSPDVGLIVDATNPTWNPSFIKFTMPDNDAVEISTATNAVSRYFPRVGTENMGIAVRPGTGDIYVANSDARNLVFYENVLKGHLVDHRISRIAFSNGAVTPVDLNPGVDYTQFPNNASLSTMLASPMDLVFDPTGSHLWVAALGTDRVAKVDPNGVVLARVEIGPSAGAATNPRTKRGPRGLALLASAQRLYVSNRLSNTISVVDAAAGVVVNEVPTGAYDPTPATIREGRGFLYDSKLSGNGSSSCASCHIDADIDLLAWDLGNQNGQMQTVPDPAGLFGNFQMHPMKGPMTTQTLKGLTPDEAPLHWRGDRNDFTAFNPAFASLLGGTQLSSGDMIAFRDFIETIRFEPNPNRNLDNTLPTSLAGFTGNPQTGQNTFTTNQYQTLLTCNTCHNAATGGQTAAIIPATALQESQAFNVPQLRNLYMKMGFNNAPGAQSRGGFGFIHDGAFTNLFAFLSQPVFGNVSNDSTRKNNLQTFLLCFDTGTAPAVGYTRTVTQANAGLAAVIADVTLLQSQAAAGACDLIIKGFVDGARRGFTYQPAQGSYKSDKTGYGPFTWTQLQTKLAAGGATLSFTGVPAGTGNRMGIDRNANGVLDGDEVNNAALVNYGAASPPCAGPIAMSGNSIPYIGNSLFALTGTGIQPSSLALGLVTSQPDLAGTPFLGFTLWVDLASPEVIALDMPADATGFAYVLASVPNSPALIGVQYYGEVISLAACAAFGLGGSQGLHITIQAP